jgi:hypothetical protein
MISYLTAASWQSLFLVSYKTPMLHYRKGESLGKGICQNVKLIIQFLEIEGEYMDRGDLCQRGKMKSSNQKKPQYVI